MLKKLLVLNGLLAGMVLTFSLTWSQRSAQATMGHDACECNDSLLLYKTKKWHLKTGLDYVYDKIDCPKGNKPCKGNCILIFQAYSPGFGRAIGEPEILNKPCYIELTSGTSNRSSIFESTSADSPPAIDYGYTHGSRSWWEW